MNTRRWLAKGVLSLGVVLGLGLIGSTFYFSHESACLAKYGGNGNTVEETIHLINKFIICEDGVREYAFEADLAAVLISSPILIFGTVLLEQRS